MQDINFRCEIVLIEKATANDMFLTLLKRLSHACNFLTKCLREVRGSFILLRSVNSHVCMTLLAFFTEDSTNSRNDVTKISFPSKLFERKKLFVRLEKEKIRELLRNSIRIGFFERIRSKIMNFKIQS